MLAPVGVFSARLLRPTWVGPLVFVALLAFAAWAVSLSFTVRTLRDDVEQLVGWLRVITEALASDAPSAELLDDGRMHVTYVPTRAETLLLHVAVREGE